MKVALLGYGKMGKLIEALCRAQGHDIIARISRQDDTSIADADVCIDFSHADAVVDHALMAARAGKSLVIGTTGWEEHLPTIRNIVEKHPIAAIHAPNFSVGVHLFRLLVQEAAKLMRGQTAYDVCGWEMHHKRKADAPSGTAKMLAETLAHTMQRAAPLAFSSVRCGEVPGTHAVIFDSAADTITLTHEARDRSGFAQGAIDAAAWIRGKRGFFTLDDMIQGG